MTAFSVKRRCRAETQRFLREPCARTGRRASPTSKTRFYIGAAVDLVFVREIERASERARDRERRKKCIKGGGAGEWDARPERRRTKGVEPHRGGWNEEGVRGPGFVGPDEKSVIIIITAERATIINHH